MDVMRDVRDTEVSEKPLDTLARSALHMADIQNSCRETSNAGRKTMKQRNVGKLNREALVNAMRNMHDTTVNVKLKVDIPGGPW